MTEKSLEGKVGETWSISGVLTRTLIDFVQHAIKVEWVHKSSENTKYCHPNHPTWEGEGYLEEENPPQRREWKDKWR